MKRTMIHALTMAGLLSVAGCPTPVAMDVAMDPIETSTAAANVEASSNGEASVSDTPAAANAPDATSETPVAVDVPAAPTATPSDPVPAAPNVDAVTAFPAGMYAGEMQSRVNVYVNNDLVDSMVQFDPLEIDFDEDGLPVFEDGTLLVVGSTTKDEQLTLTVTTVDIADRTIEFSQTGTLADDRIVSGTYTGTTSLEYLDTHVHYSNQFSIVVTFPDGGIQRQDWALTCDLTQ